jgi:hypothetical protein
MSPGVLYVRAMASTQRIVDARLDPEVVSACIPVAQKLTQQFRAAGVFGDDLSGAADGDPQAKLLGLVGRRPWGPFEKQNHG